MAIAGKGVLGQTKCPHPKSIEQILGQGSDVVVVQRSMRERKGLIIVCFSKLGVSVNTYRISK